MLRTPTSKTSCENEDKDKPKKAIIKSTLRIVYFFVNLKNIITYVRKLKTNLSHSK
jgi:hypothetical protein